MDLRKLRQFVAVAREMHFGRAAAALGMAQPPLSQAIARLENELGLALFHRVKRRVTLTDAGRQLLGDARQLLARADELANQMHAIARGDAGEVRVGYNAPAIHGFLARELRTFRRQHPDVRLQLRELTSEEQIHELRVHRLHIGFLRMFGEPVDPLRAQRVFSEPYLLALPADHALARRRRVRLADLVDVEMIRFPREVAPSYMDWMAQWLREAGLQSRVCVEATSGYANVALVAAGLGLAFAPRSMTRWPYPGVAYRPFADTLPDIHTHMLWTPDPPLPAVQTLIEFIQRRAQETGCFARSRPTRVRAAR